MNYEQFQEFYQGKKILITGHTGFKGTWLTKIMCEWGAKVAGIALEPPTNPSLYGLVNQSLELESNLIDIRDFEKVNKIVQQFQPEIIFHLAAQPLVLESYANPLYTYETNVMGTVHICEAIRNSKTVKSVVNVTTDKVYENKEWEWGYRECDRLNGFDPYSNSKSCSELITDSYNKSFFAEKKIAISTVRAGNVIGGGDFAENRIIPDCIRAAMQKKEIKVRNIESTRPYQHVLEAISAYLLVAKMQYEDYKHASAYNVGPNEDDCIKTGDLVELFCGIWEENVTWKSVQKTAVHEASFLKLDSSKIKNYLGWHPKWNVQDAVAKTIEWEKKYHLNNIESEGMSIQIKDYFC